MLFLTFFKHSLNNISIFFILEIYQQLKSKSSPVVTVFSHALWNTVLRLEFSIYTTVLAFKKASALVNGGSNHAFKSGHT